MKIRKLLLAIIGIFAFAEVQFAQRPVCMGMPNPLASTAGALSCNTGNNGFGSSLSVNSLDNFWTVSRNGITGSYVRAVVCGNNIVTNGGWVPSFSSSADWIT